MREYKLGRCDVLTIGVTIAVFSGLLLPALLRAREAERATNCVQRMATVATSILAYADQHSGSLPNNRKQPFTGWNTLVLPYMDQEELFDQYDLGENWWEKGNREIGLTSLSDLICPAAPHGDRKIHLLDPEGNTFEAAATDYVASSGAYLFRNKQQQLFRGAMASPGRTYGASKVTAGHEVKLSEITDGSSSTLLIVEMADKPNKWGAGKLIEKDSDEPRPLVDGYSFGQWIAPNWNHLRAYSQDGKKQFGTCSVNCSNHASIYSFHEGFANVAFADGSVKPLRAGLDEEVLVALVSIADGEVISVSDYEFRGR